MDIEEWWEDYIEWTLFKEGEEEDLPFDPDGEEELKRAMWDN